MLKSFLLLAAAASGGLAAVVRKNWTIGWVNAAPDGFSRPVIGINGQWPCPILEANVGDKIIVQVNNNLGNQSTSIHWHGIMHRGTPHMDGASHVTQCPIPPGETFTYEFVVDMPGTYWYHAHVGAQYSDGLRAPFIVRNRKDPYRKDYDQEYVLTLSDWYHDQTPTVLQELFSTANVQARPVLPSAGLINDAQRAQYKMQPGKRYKFRIVNMSALAPAFLFFDAHKMSVVEIDAVSTRRAEAEMLYIVPGQRYSVIVEAKADGTMENFAINAVFDLQPDYRKPVPTLGFNVNATAYLQYDTAKPDPGPTLVSRFNPFDDLSLMPFEDTPLLGTPDQRIQVDFRVGVDPSGIPRGFINNINYVHQKTPTLYTALTVGADAEDPAVYGQVNPHVVKRGQIVEIELNNLTPGHHPFHLHGHHFQVVSHRGAGPSNSSSFHGSPMLRDGIDVLSLGSATIRFRADNPGVWLLHCHIEWHMPMGMAVTIVEDPLGLQRMISRLPRDHLAVCKKGCWPTAGNAAGNAEDHFNLAGATDATFVPLTGAMYKQGNCASGPGNGTDGTNGNGNADADGSDSQGPGGSGKPGDGVSDQGVDSGGPGGCPSGCTCSGPVIIRPPKKHHSGCGKGGVHVEYVTEAYYITSTSTSTSTSTVCARPTTH